MRPLQLTFQAFGSYPGCETVDFTVLAQRGLFVVSGPTGTGKTTVFDALAFALYGRLPGGRDTEPRSHHAAPDVETFVSLVFDVGSERYEVHRTPAQERPRRRGVGVTLEAPTARLVRITDAGREPLATRVTDCNEQCSALVGLDVEQFQRVVLLPQGKFAQFLLARSSDREDLLSQLFGGQLYDDATTALKDRFQRLAQQVDQVAHQVDHHLTNARDAVLAVCEAWDLPTPDDLSDADALRRAVEAMDPVIRDRHQQVVDARHRLAVRDAERVAQEQLATQWDDWQTARHTWEVLESRRPEIDHGRAALEASRRARPPVEAQRRLEEARTQAGEAGHRLAEVQQRLDEVLTPLGHSAQGVTPASLTQALSHLDQDVRAHQQRLDALDLARRDHHDAHAHEQALRTRVAEMMEERTTLERHVATLRQQQEAARPAMDATAVLATQLAQAEERVVMRRRLDDLDRRRPDVVAQREQALAGYLEVMERFIATQAPRLAATLEPGTPCPVCGSSEHPAPATFDDGDVVDHAAVEQARAARDGVEAALAELDARRAQLQGSLGDAATASLDDLHRQVSLLTERLDEAGAAAEQHAAAEEALAQAVPRLEQLLPRLASAQDEVAAAHGRTADRLLALGAAQEAAHGLDADELADRRALIGQAKRWLNDLDAALTAVTTARAHEAARQAAFDETLVASGFHDAMSAAGAWLDDDEERRLDDALATWHDDHTRVGERLRFLEQQGVPPERPDTAAATAEVAQLRDALVEQEHQHTRGVAQVEHAQRALEAAADIGREAASLLVDHDVTRRVFRTCNGETGARTRLRTWVLASELERVTDAANAHLARMTGHRYRLQRTDMVKGGGRTGLDLVVHDAHTGRARPTGSLSGGEQFQASLALALGLADVVSQGGVASGKQFEALFVDEGFGSLDPEALDDAIAALMHLQATGRMVGAITHVEAMKQQLHVGIDVRRLPSGRGSTLVVNP